MLALAAARAAAADVWPMPDWQTAKPEELGLDAALLHQARDYALTGGGAGCITRGGKLVISWGNARKRFDLKSTSKSIGVTALGLALKDGKLNLNDAATKHHPAFGVPPESNAATGWLDHITILQLATQTAGFEKPGGYGKLLFKPGTAEQRGDGAEGKKVSGLLMVDGVLYLLARNAGNSQLAWSADHGRTWTWSDWKFTDSFACPTFLNFGRNYAGARDDFVYVYSHDGNSAYRPADRMVLARVDRREIQRRESYEFFAGLDAAGQPTWTHSLDDRAAVFMYPGRCYRSTISYNAPLRRYLWCQILPGDDPRFAGGLGIYDAPEPWGPWTTAFFVETWDVGPGETAGVPTKWIDADGLGLHLVFSGNDCFSVRQATLSVD
jgi:hypothetical protein